MDQAIREWRKSERARLLTLRLAIPLETRTDAASVVAARIGAHVKPGQVFSFYWPMKGEMDFRPLATELHARGIRLALPVVIERGHPMQFRPWSPGCAMGRGIWNIPQPATSETVHPDVALAPVLGFTDDCYRLGYGGGYFDRTLAALAPRPFTIGIGFACQRIATIHPQPHDIRLDTVLSEEGIG
ncbi:5-formyltetrahydrofolate cyclo-ligase [soil metagenome]